MAKKNRFKKMSCAGIITEAGWNVPSQLILLEDFITERGLDGKLLKYLAKRAHLEEQESGDLG